MIGTDRSYEHRSIAIDRSHLMPVAGSVHAALTNPDGEGWRKSLALWVAVLGTIGLLWSIFA